MKYYCIDCPLFPELNKLKDFVILHLFAQICIGIAKDTGTCILGKKGQDTFLPAAAFGNIMLFHQGIFTMERNGMEIGFIPLNLRNGAGTFLVRIRIKTTRAAM